MAPKIFPNIAWVLHGENAVQADRSKKGWLWGTENGEDSQVNSLMSAIAKRRLKHWRQGRFLSDLAALTGVTE